MEAEGWGGGGRQMQALLEPPINADLGGMNESFKRKAGENN